MNKTGICMFWLCAILNLLLHKVGSIPVIRDARAAVDSDQSARLQQDHEDTLVLMEARSESDSNDYRIVTLDNGIKCLLVYNNSTAVAELQLRVGAGDVAEDVVGLAHLVEHLMFDGSLNYPDPQSYIGFIRGKGGYLNGETWETSTCYMFDIVSDGLEEASRMLADKMVNPLFAEDRIKPVIQDIQNEFMFNWENYYWKFRAVAFAHTNPESRHHPINGGNMETLNVTGIRDKAIEFHDKFYSGNLMKLAVVADIPLNRLEGIVKSTFGTIPNKNTTPVYNRVPLFDADNLNRLFYMRHWEDISELLLLFPIMMEGHPDLMYIRYLFEVGGEGSLITYLSEENYAWYVTTFEMVTDPFFVPFVIAFSLTEKGEADPFFVVEAFFKFMSKVSVDPDVWHQERDKLHFDRYMTPYAYLDIMDVSSDPRDYLGSTSHKEFDLAKEELILSFLSPDNFNMYVTSSQFSADEATDNSPRLSRMDKYFNTPYELMDIPKEAMLRFKNVSADSTLQIQPKKNDIILNVELFDDDASSAYPTLIDTGSVNQAKLWWYNDNEFNLPQLTLDCRVRSSKVTHSERSSAIHLMLNKIFKTAKNLHLRPFVEAEIHPQFIAAKDWQFSIHGYSDPERVESGLSHLMDVFFNIDLTLTQDDGQFDRDVRTPLLSSHSHTIELDKNPSYLIDSLLRVGHENMTVVRDYVGNLSPEEIKSYVDEYLAEVSMTCSALGNLKREQAVEYSSVIVYKLSTSRPSTTFIEEDQDNSMLRVKVRKLPEGVTQVIRRRALDDREESKFAVNVLYIFGPDEEVGGKEYYVSTMKEVLAVILGSRCFSYLRTEKQLGYIAACQSVTIENTYGFEFIFRGHHLDDGPHIIVQEVDNFVKLIYQDMIANVTAVSERLESARLALHLGSSKSIFEKLGGFEEVIFDPYKTDFLHGDKMMKVVEELTSEEIIDFFKHHFVGEQKRVISSEVYGKDYEIPTTVNKTRGEILIEDIASYAEKIDEYW